MLTGGPQDVTLQRNGSWDQADVVIVHTERAWLGARTVQQGHLYTSSVYCC